MSDDKTKRHRDAERISMTEDYEVRDWCAHYSCTPDELKEAVNAVGTTRRLVDDWFAKNPPRKPRP